MSTPSHPITDWYRITTRIRDRGDGRATGFFYRDNEKVYLITNKHVLDKISINDEPLQEVRIFTRPESDDLTNLSYHDLKLIHNGEPTWLTHPSKKEIDVTVIPLKPPVVPSAIDVDLFVNENAATGTVAISKKDTRPDPVLIGTGQQVMTICYPIETNPPHWPIIRNGLISTPYGEETDRLPYFLVDARMHPGTSGSPVLTLPSPRYTRIEDKDGEVDITHPYLLGVHSGDFRYETVGQNSKGPLDLNPVWYIETVRDIIEG